MKINFMNKKSQWNSISKMALMLLTATLLGLSTSAQTITVGVDFGNSHVLQKDVYGCNNWLGQRPFYINHPDLIDKYNALGKPVMRYPGGTAPNYLNKTTGFYEAWDNDASGDAANRAEGFNDNLVENGKAQKVSGVYQGDGFDLDKYIDFLDKTGGKSTFVLNISVMDKNETIQVLNQIQAAGEKLDYVEIGNELYFGVYQVPHPNLTDYMNKANERAAEVRLRFPNAKIGILLPSIVYSDEDFVGGGSGGTGRQQQWLGGLRALENNNNAAFAAYDALVIHLYSKIGIDREDQPPFHSFETSYNHCISHADNKFEEAMNLVRTDFPDKEIWVTEYHVGGFSDNLRLANYRFRFSYLGGLFATNFMLKLFSQEEITLSSWHTMHQWLTFTDPPAGSLLGNQVDFGVTVNHDFFKLFQVPVAQSNRFAKVNFTGVSNYQGLSPYTGSFSEMEGGCFYDESTGKGYLMVVNKRGKNSYRINKTALENVLQGTIDKCTEVAPSSRQAARPPLERTEELDMGEISVNGSGNYELRAHSVYIFEYQGQPSGGNTSEVTLENVNSGELLISNNNVITTGNSNSNNHHVWIKEPMGGNNFRLKNKKNNKYLASNSNNNDVVETTDLSNPNRVLWEFKTAPNGNYYIDNVLRENNGQTSRLLFYNNDIVLGNSSNAIYQNAQWSEDINSGGNPSGEFVRLANVTTGTLLRSAGGTLSAEQVWQDDFSLWKKTSGPTTNTYYLQNEGSQKFMAAESTSNDVILTTNQDDFALWTFTPTGGNYYLDNVGKGSNTFRRLKLDNNDVFLSTINNAGPKVQWTESTVSNFKIVADPVEELFIKATSKEMRIYPNPSIGTFTISSFGFENQPWKLVNTLGQEIRSGVIDKNDFQLIIEEKGMYFFIIEGISKTLMVK